MSMEPSCLAKHTKKFKPILWPIVQRTIWSKEISSPESCWTILERTSYFVNNVMNIMTKSCLLPKTGCPYWKQVPKQGDPCYWQLKSKPDDFLYIFREKHFKRINHLLTSCPKSFYIEDGTDRWNYCSNTK